VDVDFAGIEIGMAAKARVVLGSLKTPHISL